MEYDENKSNTPSGTDAIRLVNDIPRETTYLGSFLEYTMHVNALVQFVIENFKLNGKYLFLKAPSILTLFTPFPRITNGTCNNIIGETGKN